ERHELRGLHAAGALRPRVHLRMALRLEEPLVQRAPAARVVDEPRAHVREPDALEPRRRPLEITRLLAIELQECAAVLEHLLFRRDLAEESRGPHLDAAVTADVQLVARFDADDAQVLDRRLGAVARAARDRELDLVRVPRAPRHPLEANP